MRKISDIRAIANAMLDPASRAEASLEERQAATLGLIVDLCDNLGPGLSVMARRLRSLVPGGQRPVQPSATPAEGATAPAPPAEPTGDATVDWIMAGVDGDPAYNPSVQAPTPPAAPVAPVAESAPASSQPAAPKQGGKAQPSANGA